MGRPANGVALSAVCSSIWWRTPASLGLSSWRLVCLSHFTRRRRTNIRICFRLTGIDGRILMMRMLTVILRVTSSFPPISRKWCRTMWRRICPRTTVATVMNVIAVTTANRTALHANRRAQTMRCLLSRRITKRRVFVTKQQIRFDERENIAG